MTTTRALCKFGVSHLSDLPLESSVLAVADEFRRELCAIYQERANAVVDLRNRLYPSLFAALVEWEAAKAAVWIIEREIKAHHSEVRDRNAVTPEMEDRLAAARERVTAAAKSVKTERAVWSTLLREFSAWWRGLADWKNVKDLGKRKLLYAAIVPPAPLADYAALWMAFDLRERDLYRAFEPRLHPAIRAEIVESSRPKLTKDAPGMRYFYGRRPEIKPWQKLSLQFVGGLTWEQVLAGESRALRAEPFRVKADGSGAYKVWQQIGTAKNPQVVGYVLNVDKPFPADAVIQWWALCVRPGGKREVVPIVKLTDGAKPQGSGVLSYRLCWTRRKDGVEVARFWGDHVNERLVLSNRLLANRMAVKDAQQECDGRANGLLSSRGAAPPAGGKQGVEALAVYCHQHLSDVGAGNLLDECQRAVAAALKTSQRAARSIEDIYRLVASRVCQRHSALAAQEIDLRRIKRYDTRDLLREDVLPLKSREIMHAAAPGKLKALLNGYGLASSDVAPPEPGDARGTDLFTSYVASLGSRSRSNRGGNLARSQRASVAQTA